MTVRRWYAATILILSTTVCLHAQGLAPDTTAGSKGMPPGTAEPPRILQSDTVVAPLGLPAKSPGTAVLLSAILPGAGQFYNRSYWKVPVVTGLGLYFVSEWLTNNRRYKDYRAQYAAALSLPSTSNSTDALLSLREFYKDQRDSFTWYFLILYVVNLADAYVDASLFNFDVGGSLSQNSVPSMRLTLHVKF
ncbi:MAG: DUF5683 domain-containing protein [Bacteroidota bacterium]